MTTLTTNITHYYSYDSGATDAVGGNNGTVSGATNTAAKLSNGYSFNGSSNYINHSTTGIVSTGASAKSIALWIKATNFSGTRRIFTTGGASSTQGFTIMQYSGTSKIYFTDEGVAYTGTTTLSNDTWYHVAVTYDGTNIRFYLNGSLESTSARTLATTATETNIGRSSGGSEFFLGLIDELGIWDKMLTNAEVLELYNSGTGITYPFATANTSSMFQMF